MEKINILGIEYNIEYKEIEEDVYGVSNFKKSKIFIDSGLSEQARKVVLWHEAIHMIMDSNSGIKDLTETQIDQLAVGVLSILKNNDINKLM